MLMSIFISLNSLSVFASSLDGVLPTGVQPPSVGGFQEGLLDKLILQDQAPWGTSSNQLAISDNGFSYTVVDTATFPTVDLSPYKVIILAGQQKPAYYAAINSDPIRSILSNFVLKGGVLLVHMAAMQTPLDEPASLNLPGATSLGIEWDGTNDVSVADPGHPIMDGPWGVVTDTNMDIWSASSHGHFTNLPYNTLTIMVEGPISSNPGKPTYVQWRFGDGIVVATRSPLEFGYTYLGTDNSMRPLRNEIAFAQAYKPIKPVGGELVALSPLPLSSMIALTIIVGASIAAGVTLRRRMKA
jgi:hypothetical protein